MSCNDNALAVRKINREIRFSRISDARRVDDAAALAHRGGRREVQHCHKICTDNVYSYRATTTIASGDSKSLTDLLAGRKAVKCISGTVGPNTIWIDAKGAESASSSLGYDSGV